MLRDATIAPVSSTMPAFTWAPPISIPRINIGSQFTLPCAADRAIRNWATPHREPVRRYHECGMKLFLCLALTAGALAAQTFPGSQAIDAAVYKAIDDNRLPGAVVIVGHDGQIVHRKAYGKDRKSVV